MNEIPPQLRLEMFETLCDNLRDSILVLDGDNYVFHANRRFCEATGLSRKQVIGCHISELQDFVRDDSFSTLTEHVDAVVRGDARERRVRLCVESPVEGPSIVEARITPSGLRLEGAAVVLRDVTELVRNGENTSGNEDREGPDVVDD